MTRAPRYDTIGRSYATARVEDPRIAAQIHAALGDAATVVNVGAGTGNYEPRDRRVVAVEPSPTMLGQRPPGAAPAVLATAEALPLRSDGFDVAMAVLTLHHWSDVPAGLAELARVAPRQVIFFFEPLVVSEYWILDYFPAVADIATERHAPGERELAAALEVLDVRPVLVPSDCRDGFGAAYWARPEAYLDPVVQAGISSLALLDPAARAAGTESLRQDLASGRWLEQYGHWLERESFDAGYRLARCARRRARRS